MASKCVPLKITAVLADGRLNSSNGLIMFDAILYHAWFIKYAPQVLDGEYSNGDGYIGLPLQHLPNNRWAASKGIYTEIDQKIEYFNKRPDFFAADKQNYLSQETGIIDDRAGVYRAYRVPQLIRTVKNGIITFYAVGNKQKIEDLLNTMVSVGKKGSIGYGFINQWIVDEIENDYTTEHPVHGLMRPIEVAEATKKYNCPIMHYAIKPPYWKQKNMRLCYVPVPIE